MDRRPRARRGEAVGAAACTSTVVEAQSLVAARAAQVLVTQCELDSDGVCTASPLCYACVAGDDDPGRRLASAGEEDAEEALCISPAQPSDGGVNFVFSSDGTPLERAPDIEYKYHPVLTVRALIPTVGPALGGTVVVVRGDALSLPMFVHFGDELIEASAGDADGEIRFVSPPTVAGDVFVAVSRNGIQPSASERTFTAYTPPTLSATAPACGPSPAGALCASVAAPSRR